MPKSYKIIQNLYLNLIVNCFNLKLNSFYWNLLILDEFFNFQFFYVFFYFINFKFNYLCVIVSDLFLHIFNQLYFALIQKFYQDFPILLTS